MSKKGAINPNAPTIVTVDGKTYLATLQDNVLTNAYNLGNSALSREVLYDYIEMTLIGNLPSFTMNPNTSFVTREMSEPEKMNWTIVQAAYARAEEVKDNYLVVTTVNAIKSGLG